MQAMMEANRQNPRRLHRLHPKSNLNRTINRLPRVEAAL